MFRSSPVSGSRYLSQVRPEPRGGKDGGSDIDEGDFVHDEASSLLRSDARPFPSSVGAAGGIFGGSYGGGSGGGFRNGKRRLRTLAACAALVVAALVLAACAVVDVADAWLGLGGTRRAAGLERCVPQDIPGRFKGNGKERWGRVRNGGEGWRIVGNVRRAVGLERCVLQNIPGRCKGNGGERWGMVGSGGEDVPSLSEMTVEEKVGQMMQIDERALGYGDNITVYHIGSVLSPSQVCAQGHGMATVRPQHLTAWADMADNFQAKALSAPASFPVLSRPYTPPCVISSVSGGGAWPQYAPNTPTAWADMVDNLPAKALNTCLPFHAPPVPRPCAVVFPPTPVSVGEGHGPNTPPTPPRHGRTCGGGAWPQYAPNTPTAWADMVDNLPAKALNTCLPFHAPPVPRPCAVVFPPTPVSVGEGHGPNTPPTPPRHGRTCGGGAWPQYAPNTPTAWADMVDNLLAKALNTCLPFHAPPVPRPCAVVFPPTPVSVGEGHGPNTPPTPPRHGRTWSITYRQRHSTRACPFMLLPSLVLVLLSSPLPPGGGAWPQYAPNTPTAWADMVDNLPAKALNTCLPFHAPPVPRPCAVVFPPTPVSVGEGHGPNTPPTPPRHGRTWSITYRPRHSTRACPFMLLPSLVLVLLSSPLPPGGGAWPQYAPNTPTAWADMVDNLPAKALNTCLPFHAPPVPRPCAVVFPPTPVSVGEGHGPNTPPTPPRHGRTWSITYRPRHSTRACPFMLLPSLVLVLLSSPLPPGGGAWPQYAPNTPTAWADMVDNLPAKALNTCLPFHAPPVPRPCAVVFPPTPVSVGEGHGPNTPPTPPRHGRTWSITYRPRHSTRACPFMLLPSLVLVLLSSPLPPGGGAWPQYAPNTPTAWADMVDNLPAKALNTCLPFHAPPVPRPCAVVFPPTPVSVGEGHGPNTPPTPPRHGRTCGGGAWPQYAPNTPTAWADMVDNLPAKALNTCLPFHAPPVPRPCAVVFPPTPVSVGEGHGPNTPPTPPRHGRTWSITYRPRHSTRACPFMLLPSLVLVLLSSPLPPGGGAWPQYAPNTPTAWADMVDNLPAKALNTCLPFHAPPVPRPCAVVFPPTPVSVGEGHGPNTPPTPPRHGRTWSITYRPRHSTRACPFMLLPSLVLVLLSSPLPPGGGAWPQYAPNTPTAWADMVDNLPAKALNTCLPFHAPPVPRPCAVVFPPTPVSVGEGHGPNTPPTPPRHGRTWSITYRPRHSTRACPFMLLPSLVLVLLSSPLPPGGGAWPQYAPNTPTAWADMVDNLPAKALNTCLPFHAPPVPRPCAVVFPPTPVSVGEGHGPNTPPTPPRHGRTWSITYRPRHSTRACPFMLLPSLVLVLLSSPLPPGGGAWPQYAPNTPTAWADMVDNLPAKALNTCLPFHAPPVPRPCAVVFPPTPVSVGEGHGPNTPPTPPRHGRTWSITYRPRHSTRACPFMLLPSLVLVLLSSPLPPGGGAWPQYAPNTPTAWADMVDNLPAKALNTCLPFHAPPVPRPCAVVFPPTPVSVGEGHGPNTPPTPPRHGRTWSITYRPRHSTRACPFMLLPSLVLVLLSSPLPPGGGAWPQYAPNTPTAWADMVDNLPAKALNTCLPFHAPPVPRPCAVVFPPTPVSVGEGHGPNTPPTPPRHGRTWSITYRPRHSTRACPFMLLPSLVLVLLSSPLPPGGGAWPQYAPNTPTAWADMVDNLPAKALNTCLPFHAPPVPRPCAVVFPPTPVSVGEGHGPNTPPTPPRHGRTWSITYRPRHSTRACPFMLLPSLVLVLLSSPLPPGGGAWPQYAPNTPTAWADMVDNLPAKALNTCLPFHAPPVPRPCAVVFPPTPVSVGEGHGPNTPPTPPRHGRTWSITYRPRHSTRACPFMLLPSLVLVLLSSPLPPGGGAWPQYAPNTPTAWADMVDNFQAKALNTCLRPFPRVVFFPPIRIPLCSGGGAWPQYAPNTPTAWADMVDNFPAKALNTCLPFHAPPVP
ncbi:unnamed protein product, partial [Closterium sp. Naga37s-1]